MGGRFNLLEQARTSFAIYTLEDTTGSIPPPMLSLRHWRYYQYRNCILECVSSRTFSLSYFKLYTRHTFPPRATTRSVCIIPAFLHDVAGQDLLSECPRRCTYNLAYATQFRPRPKLFRLTVTASQSIRGCRSFRVYVRAKCKLQPPLWVNDTACVGPLSPRLASLTGLQICAALLEF